jgi:hypothetical protein
MNFKFVLFIHSAIASLSGYPYSSVPNLVNGNADTFTINGCSVPKQRALFGDDFIDIMTPVSLRFIFRLAMPTMFVLVASLALKEI